MNHLKNALNCDRHIFIQACAGAGKTFALTKRYAAILDSFAQELEKGANSKTVDHSKILVITFTKKAAGEMNERILKDVNILLSGNEISEMKKQGIDFCPTLRTSQHNKVREYTKNLNDTFSQNSISTIDSFCARILREFAFKLDLDPQFLSQDEHDTKRLLNETLDTWVGERLTGEPDYFNDLLDEFNFYQIKEILKSMVASREILDDYLKGFENKSDEEIWRNWLVHYLAQADVEMLSIRFDSLWLYAQDNCSDTQDALYILLKDLNDQFRDMDRNGDPLEYRSRFFSILRSTALFTSGKGYRVSLPGNKGNWKEGKGLAEDWFDLLKRTDAKDIQMSPGPQDKKIIPLLRSLIKSYQDFNLYFSDIRRDRDLLDFSDIIILTHQLLKEHDDVREILGKRYRHIMLDEFQDTNPLRWEIIKMILEAGEDIKLFIVGDRKQSIYRFNNADVTVMDSAEELIRSLNGDVLDFNDNYRSSQTLINEAINPLMRMILKTPGESREKYEAVFDDTSSPSNKPGLLGDTLERIWCVDNKEDENNVSAFHTAYQVKRLLEKYRDSGIDEHPDKPLIAVLLRRFTKISEYVQAFHQFGVSVSIFGGKDFYASTAVKDIFHLISILDNPLDDLALVGLLRSPFFSMPDPVIHRLADRGKASAFDAMSSIPELQSAYREILTWREQLKTKSIDAVISDIMDDQDRELGYVSELMPEQQLANFDKALNIIRGLQRSGSSLREIRDYLHYQITTGADESQAVYPADARVQILTVHKAKGLEFPIVVIPEMNAKGNSDKNKFRYGRSHDRPEISLSLSDENKPGMLMRLKEITKQEEKAEEKRVFYVAVTRAVHKVILLGEGKKALANTWWAKYVLGINEEAEKDQLKPEAWGKDIECLNKETVMSGIDPVVIESLSWCDEEHLAEPGSYLYRSPHDLMGHREDYSYSDAASGLGTAPGSVFHDCMERGWLHAGTYEKEIKNHIAESYSDIPSKELWEKVRPWLLTVHDHPVGTLLRDPGIEKYHELKVRGWLKNQDDIVQVNGTVDLLYNDGERWRILDFKTDADKRRLPDYRKQLQSYQWMVKQAYGIEASAGIYFVSLNEIEDVQWDEAYFDQLPFDRRYQPGLSDTSVDLSKLFSVLQDGPHLILCASAQHEEQVYLAMVKQGWLRPNIEISTLSKFVQKSEAGGLSQDKLRLMIRHQHPGMKNGTADLLAKALREEELQKGTVKKEFRASYQPIINKTGYRSAEHPYRQATAGNRRVILLDVYASTELEKELIARLSRETELLQLMLGSDRSAKKYTLLESFSPREEVLACAEHIIRHAEKNEQILIAVASMEKYAPHLHRQFPKYGLSVRFIGPKSLYEVPCTSLLMTYLKLSAKDTGEWQEIAPLLLDPNLKPDDRFFAFDKTVRQHPMDDYAVPPTGLPFCTKTSDLMKFTENFIKLVNTDNDPDTCRACETFLGVLERVIGDMTQIDPQVKIVDIYREMAERIKKESMPRRDQWNGIPVVGLLDSLGVQADKLYVLGMVEGDIPRQENDNPFFIKNQDYSLNLNRHFMNEWMKRGEQVIFSTSIHAEDGAEQRRSSFFEGMDLNVVAGKGLCRRDELLAYRNKKITGRISSAIERHHEILNAERGIFSGDISMAQRSFDVRVTSVDTLLACPMRFYFDNVMNCPSLDQDEALYWGSKRGNVIHKTFEAFIQHNGYALDLDDALYLMKDCLDQALEIENIDRHDSQQMDQFRNYVRDLTAGSDKNCLAINLETIKKNYSDYTQFESEMDFKELKLEHPVLEISLRGRIDKIMINKDEKKMIASDYKTGSVKTSLLSKMMLSQLFLYLKYCAETYAGYEQKAMYELLKKPEDCKMVEYMQVDNEFKQLGKNARQSLIIPEFEQHLQKLFSQISEGKYYITEKDYSDTCKHCPYDGLCRRDTRLKIKEN